MPKLRNATHLLYQIQNGTTEVRGNQMIRNQTVTEAGVYTVVVYDVTSHGVELLITVDD